MTIASDIRKLLDAQRARVEHQAQMRARIALDPTTRRARIASILTRAEAGHELTPNQQRIVELFGIAQARKDAAEHADIA